MGADVVDCLCGCFATVLMLWGAINVVALSALAYDRKDINEAGGLWNYLIGPGLVGDVKDVYKTDGRVHAIGFVTLFAPVVLLLFSLALAIEGVKTVFRTVVTSVSFGKEFLLMKRKLFTTMLLLTLGYSSPTLFDSAVEWWKAPPAPPSQETLKLVESLTNADGWTIMPSGSVQKGNVYVRPGTFRASIEIHGADCADQFSNADLRAMNKAVSVCMRKLAIRNLDVATQTASQKETVVTKGN